MTRSSRKRCARSSAGCWARSRRPAAARRASFLHHLQDPRRGRRHPAASRRALPGRDDDRHPEPLLGPEGRRRWFRGRPVSFNQAPAKLSIPFAAITGFHDPAVNFQLAFQAHDDGARAEHERARTTRRPRRRSRTDRTSSRWISSGRSRRPSVRSATRGESMNVTNTRTETDSFGPIEVPGRRLLGRADPALDREFPVRPARADAGRDRPRAGLREAGGGAGERARRRARRRSSARRSSRRPARSRPATMTTSSRSSSGRPAPAPSPT